MLKNSHLSKQLPLHRLTGKYTVLTGWKKSTLHKPKEFLRMHIAVLSLLISSPRKGNLLGPSTVETCPVLA